MKSSSWKKSIFGICLGLASLSQAKPPWKVYSYLEGGDVDPRTGAAISYNSLPWSDITHVIDAFAIPNSAPTLNLSNTNGAGLISVAHSNSTRCNLSIGGEGGGANFGTDTNATNAPAFVAAITNTVQSLGYDGADIDWEFPTAAQETQFTNFMTALYTAIKAMPSAYDGKARDLTFFISAGGQLCGVNWAQASTFCDAGIMSGYDYFIDNYNGPLSDPGSTYSGACALSAANGDIEGTYAKLTTAGMVSSKLALGCPLYGNGPPADGLPVIDLLTIGTGLVYHSPQSEFSINYPGGYGYSTSGVEYADNAQSFCDKINWCLANGLQGIGLWEMSNAYPPTDATVSGIWSTIGGTAACVSSPTPSRTPSSSATPSRTESMTPTSTWTPTRSPTPTASPSFTMTGTPSFTRTYSPTPSITDTPSNTCTISPSPTESDSPSVTPSTSPSATFTASQTEVPPGSTATDTPTLPPTATPTDSVTVTLTPSPSLTNTSSSTVTPSVTASPSDTVSSSSTPTTTQAPSLTVTSTATPMKSPTATSTHGTTRSETRPTILKQYPVPNPQSGPTLTLSVYLQGYADTVEIKIYTKAMICMERIEVSGYYNPGWNYIVANPIQHLDSGLYYVVVMAKNGGLDSAVSPAMKLFILR